MKCKPCEQVFNRREHWSLNRAEKYFLVSLLLISSGSVGTAQPDAEQHAYAQPFHKVVQDKPTR